ncbi:hypothetical protein EZH22_17300 [Xanthobacter dioxanivorans]|uniref:DUF2214 domain-containing protein n=1 Tax=Xanthobacter dioxanivorans TaxID=2528964 RepID=A0A974SH09_9HYPH|nr:hypothetical protein [Xanthobacter dioxanivorans]QRG04897.1 hypothetical protein EZH22_17300 [Xanthobacter dioxanivorans]
MESLFALAAALEGSALGQAARASIWLYPVANLTHVLGAALLVGASATFDIAILRGDRAARWVLRAGMWLAALGLVVQVASGVVLFAAEAGPLLRNAAFLAKLAFILVGLANIAVFHLFFRPEPTGGRYARGARLAAGVSLLAWVAALLLGRTIAYV